MKTLKEYDVLRLIEHNNICYVSSDNVKGYTLAKWIQFHPYLPKEQLYQWVGEICRQLVQIHKCRGNPYYRYVNPYSIIVSEDKRLCFLDISAESNMKLVRMMQRKNIRDFFSIEEQFYSETSEAFDFYGLGRTIQYLLAFTEIEPQLSLWEERKFRKFIFRCIKQKNKKMTDILKYLPTKG